MEKKKFVHCLEEEGGFQFFTQIRRGWLPRWSMYWLNMSSSTEQSPGAETDAFCRSSSATKCISGKSLTLSSEPLVTGVIVLMEQYTTWSEEAVPGHTYSFISCANMHCLSVSSFSSRPFYLCILVGGGTGCYSWWS